MGESKSRIEPVTCPDCGVRGEVSAIANDASVNRRTVTCNVPRSL